MNTRALLASRQPCWLELEALLREMATRRRAAIGAEKLLRFSTLYRAAAADLELAESYQFPTETIDYLHDLVARAHHQLYRGRRYRLGTWGHALFVLTPRRIFHDWCVRLAFLLFWGGFILSGVLAYNKSAFPGYAEGLLGASGLEEMDASFASGLGREPGQDAFMSGFYVWHNGGIGLQCFVSGLLVVPGLLTLLFNAFHLGAAFGYMARTDPTTRAHFFEFVTAHGPFELTAIALAAGAGLRIGWSWIYTAGLTRRASLERTMRRTMPLVGAFTVLFVLAAGTEGFISPQTLPAELAFLRWVQFPLKAAFAIGSSALLVFYFVILGFPPEEPEDRP